MDRDLSKRTVRPIRFQSDWNLFVYLNSNFVCVFFFQLWPDLIYSSHAEFSFRWAGMLPGAKPVNSVGNWQWFMHLFHYLNNCNLNSLNRRVRNDIKEIIIAMNWFNFDYLSCRWHYKCPRAVVSWPIMRRVREKKLTLLSKYSVARLFYWFLPAKQSKLFGVLDAPLVLLKSTWELNFNCKKSLNSSIFRLVDENNVWRVKLNENWASRCNRL